MPFQPLAYPTATWVRRMVAVLVDWIASSLLVVAFVGPAHYTDHNWIVLGVFVLETAIFTTTLGGSFGNLVTRLRTVRTDGVPRHLDPLRALARSILIALVIPPLVFRPDGRGLHDMAAGTATVTIDVYRQHFAPQPGH